MNLSQKLHPKIWEATDEYERGLVIALKNKSADETRRLTKHHVIWFRTYGRQFFARVAPAFFALGVCAAIPPHHDHDIVLGFAIVAVAAFFETGRFLLSNRRNATAEELRNLIPDLHLSEEELAYLEGMIALSQARGMTEQCRNEIAAQLNELVDAYLTVKSQRDLLEQSIGSDPGQAQLNAEREKLVEKRELSDDPIVRNALDQTIAAYDLRLSRRKAASPALDRLDAQARLIGLTLRTVQESLTALQVAPSGVTLPEPEAILQTINNINTQSRSVEAAVQEVLSIGRS